MAVDLSARAEAFAELAARRRLEAERLIRELVEIESPTGHRDGVTRVGERLGEVLAGIGLEVEPVESERYGLHLLARGGATGAPVVCLVGHIDTVFPVGTAWPYEVEGSRASGPGVADMKGGCVVMALALATLLEHQRPSVGFQVVLAGDEEVTSPESRGLIGDHAANASWGLVFEPAGPGGTLVRARKGFGRLELRVEGRAAHAGQEPEAGLDANRELIAQCQRIGSLADPARGTTVNIGRIEGGQSSSIVAERASAAIDLRVAEQAERERIERALELVEPIAVPGASVHLEGGFERPPMAEVDGAKELQSLAQRAGQALGQSIGFCEMGGVSDANTLTALGVPTIDGLGLVGGRLHSHDEFADLDSIVPRIALTATMLSMLGDPDRDRVADAEILDREL